MAAQLFSKRHMEAHLELSPEGLSDHEKENSLVCRDKFEPFGVNARCQCRLGWWQHHAVLMSFSGRNCKASQKMEEGDCSKVQRCPE